MVSSTVFNKLLHPPLRSFSSASVSGLDSLRSTSASNYPVFGLDISSQVGSVFPISMLRIGTIIHNIEMNPGQGAKLVRSAGTSAKIMKEPKGVKHVLVKMPSGVDKLINTRCKATIGSVGNPEHNTKKLYKAGQNRWRGIRPHVRGVAMNPVDHPHGGGEGKSKSSGSHGKCSRTPWGKPTKCGYKTGPLKRKK
jgi:ribosomal protein L2